MNKGYFSEFINPETSYAKVYNDKNALRQTFLSPENKYFENKLLNTLNLHPGQSVLVLSLDSVSFFNDEVIRKISANESYYTQTPIFFMVFSYLKNQTYDTLVKECKTGLKAKKGEWSAAKFTKLNNQS